MVYVASLNKWILDIKVAYHLCSFKELFVDFRDMESNMVMKRNGQSCHKIGIIIVQVKMFDEIVRKLEEVRYVPSVR